MICSAGKKKELKSQQDNDSHWLVPTFPQQSNQNQSCYLLVGGVGSPSKLELIKQLSLVGSVLLNRLYALAVLKGKCPMIFQLPQKTKPKFQKPDKTDKIWEEWSQASSLCFHKGGPFLCEMSRKWLGRFCYKLQLGEPPCFRCRSIRRRAGGAGNHQQGNHNLHLSWPTDFWTDSSWLGFPRVGFKKLSKT